MRYRRLDLNLLIALDALLSDKSVTKAATRLNMTQPAMSGALARLREYFEDALVIQVGRQMELTPLAQSLVGPIHDVIMRIDSVIATEPSFDATRSKRHFRLTASDYVIRVLLHDVLAQMQRDAPGVTFEFRQSSGRVQEELESGEVDFVIGPEIDVMPEHPKELLFEDGYSVLAWTGNTSVGEQLSFEEYMTQKHVVFRSEHRGTAWLERWFASRYGDARQVDVAAPSFVLLPHLVVGTDRITTIQTRLAQTFLDTMPVRLIKPSFELPKLVEILQWNVHRDPDPAIRWLRTALKERAATLPPV
ncbi:LysR family transcriptional regulator [Steroidobacter sp.]|uniref:LysR family transcriptional regulator n=1 Tax=Steroidobacter sp. TaxID=1978227 RepID=UPI001A3B84F3|nr:LysR family transcriptional regulator [Steroidobacter sp.]MBL8265098.1 LysR family transcriptional regulator [Steroidobacter sp.]